MKSLLRNTAATFVCLYFCSPEAAYQVLRFVLLIARSTLSPEQAIAEVCVCGESGGCFHERISRLRREWEQKQTCETAAGHTSPSSPVTIKVWRTGCISSLGKYGTFLRADSRTSEEERVNRGSFVYGISI